jgi:hypothetical protein
MRSRNIRRPAPAPRRKGTTTNQVLAGLGLLIVGAFVALSVQKLVESRAPIASDAPSAETTAEPSADTGAVGSDAPVESVPPASAILEGLMPKTLNGITLTVQSTLDATNLSNGPNGRALNAAVAHLGKQPSDLELALAFDETGALDLTIIGFRSDGVDAATLTPIVMAAWLAAGTPGVTTSRVVLSGTPATKVSYGDGGANEYLIVFKDSVFVLETTDETLAQAAASAMTGTSGPSSTQAPTGGSPAPTSSAPASPPAASGP